MRFASSRCLSLVVMLALVAGASAFSTPSLLVKRQQNARPLLRCKGGVAAASMLDDSNKGGVWAGFKQWVAESRAGKYDAEKIGARIDETIQGSPVAMFSFAGCPFCLKAKDLLANELKVKPENIKIIECDRDPDGNAIQAVLGKRTGRTSMPSIWIKGAGYAGGCNDGGLGGVVPLHMKGELKGLLQAAGAFD